MPAVALTTNATPAGPFPNRPPPNIEQEFLDWVRDTGRPDQWRYHEKSQPPRDKDFVELKPFQIPENKRAEVGMATCPICSPNAPKYFEGKLTWYPEEGVLRAIGHECAKAHFGVERANAATAARKHREAVEGAQNFLLETLPQISALREEVKSLQAVAMVIDSKRQFLWGALTKGACQGIARQGASGVLTVEQTRTINAVDSYGKDTTRIESSVVATHSVAGMKFLLRRFTISGLAMATAQVLETVRAAGPDEALEFVVNDLKVDAYLFQADRLARSALEEVVKLRAAVAEARTFFAPDNLLSLTRWSSDGRAGAPFRIEFDPRYPARLRIKGHGRPWKEMTLPAELVAAR